MTYRAIGLMSGSSLDGLDIAFVEFTEQAGKWSFDIKATECIAYDSVLAGQLKNATSLSAREYLLLHTSFGRYCGEEVLRFIDRHQLHYQVALVASHGHTTFHLPSQHTTGQLGDGATIAAVTGLPVVSDLRAVDIALGGQGAPIVPIGEKLLWPGYGSFLNLGGIANISFADDNYIAFDVCPANRVLNLLVAESGMAYDDGGRIASGGEVNDALLAALNDLDFYRLPAPKSLANDFGTDTVFPLVRSSGLSTADELATYLAHIAFQIKQAIMNNKENQEGEILITGGGAHNTFLVENIRKELEPLGIRISVPAENLINFKEAIVMAFIGVLRWRQEFNVLSSVTGASRDSVGGALWLGAD